MWQLDSFYTLVIYQDTECTIWGKIDCHLLQFIMYFWGHLLGEEAFFTGKLLKAAIQIEVSESFDLVFSLWKNSFINIQTHFRLKLFICVSFESHFQIFFSLADFWLEF